MSGESSIPSDDPNSKKTGYGPFQIRVVPKIKIYTVLIAQDLRDKAYCIKGKTTNEDLWQKCLQTKMFHQPKISGVREVVLGAFELEKVEDGMKPLEGYGGWEGDRTKNCNFPACF
jgi:hypothetical protein